MATIKTRDSCRSCVCNAASSVPLHIYGQCPKTMAMIFAPRVARRPTPAYIYAACAFNVGSATNRVSCPVASRRSCMVSRRVFPVHGAKGSVGQNTKWLPGVVARGAQTNALLSIRSVFVRGCFWAQVFSLVARMGEGVVESPSEIAVLSPRADEWREDVGVAPQGRVVHDGGACMSRATRLSPITCVPCHAKRRAAMDSRPPSPGRSVGHRGSRLSSLLGIRG